MSLVDEKPLLQSGISERVWELYHTDPMQFKDRVKAYFALGFPGWRVVKANYAERKIYLRDERGN